jgi:hypothetical protein
MRVLAALLLHARILYAILVSRAIRIVVLAARPLDALVLGAYVIGRTGGVGVRATRLLDACVILAVLITGARWILVGTTFFVDTDVVFAFLVTRAFWIPILATDLWRTWRLFLRRRWLDQLSWLGWLFRLGLALDGSLRFGRRGDSRRRLRWLRRNGYADVIHAPEIFCANRIAIHTADLRCRYLETDAVALEFAR